MPRALPHPERCSGPSRWGGWKCRPSVLGVGHGVRAELFGSLSFVRPMPAAGEAAPSRTGLSEAGQAGPLLLGLEEIVLDRFFIVGKYARFDPRLRASLDEFRQRLVSDLAGRGGRPRNFLVWGPPGSGKSYLVQQIAAGLPSGVRFVEWNLSRLDADQFRTQLEVACSAPGPLLGFVDEIDALPEATWPYELLLSYLEPPHPRSDATCFVLAGSGGIAPAEMRRTIEGRPKGRDLLSRVPTTSEYQVSPLGVGDRVLVAATQFLEAAEEEGRPIRDVEKLALYFVATNPTFASARQLRALADQTARRIPLGETRLRFDHLFRPGDPENKEFWTRATAEVAGLSGAYIRVLSAPRDPSARSATAPVSAKPRSLGAGPPGANRIAVLPFRNISPDPTDAYLAEGLSEEITATISSVPGLEVVSRTSALGYGGPRVKSAAEIGTELRAGSLLEGSVRKVGTRLRITAQFIDAANDRQLWGETLEGELSDVFGMQKAIAARVATALRAGLGGGVGPPPRRRPAPSLEAYLSFLRGRAAYRESTREGLERAIGYFQAALDRDPDYAEALAGIAAAYGRIGFWEYAPAREPLRLAREYVDRSLAIDPDSAEARLTASQLYRAIDWDWARCETELRKAIALDPYVARAHTLLANLLSETNRYEEAAREAELGKELDPQSSGVAELAGVALLYSRRYPQAVETLRTASALDPHNTSATHNLGLALVQNGSALEGIEKMDEALRTSDSPSPIQFMELAYGYLRAGRPSDAAPLLDRLESTAASNPAWWAGAAGVYATLGRTDDAFAALGKALDHHTAFLAAHLRGDFILDPLRTDPRFASLLRRAGAGA
jgi:TolB-like protein/Tfp pilus assembly protein PilF